MSRYRIGLVVLFLLGGQALLVSQNPIPIPQRAVRVGRTPEIIPSPSAAMSDEKALEASNLKADDVKGMHTYLLQRTLSESDQTKIQDVIKRLGSADFEDRQKATQAAERFGPAAVGPLRKAAAIDPMNVNGTDFEIAYRASDVLKRVEKVPHAAVAAAVVRALAKSATPETSKILLGFLPVADDVTVVDEIRKTLTLHAVRDGKADPTLLEALKDSSALKRVTAAVALIEGGPTTQPIHIPDAYPKVREAAKVEKDTETRFSMLFALVTIAKAKDCIPDLIDLLPELPRGQLWQAEDYLLQLAGKDAPKVNFGKSKEAVTKAQTAWKEWWAKTDPSFDADKFTYTPRIQGRTLLALMDNLGGAGGAVVELGPDMKERWRINNLQSPMDVKVLADGSIAIAESQTNSVTIRDTQGRNLGTKSIMGNGNLRISGSPQQIQILENGGMLVVCRNVVVEFKMVNDKEEQLVIYNRANNYDICSALRLPTGETAVLLQNGPNHCIFLDAKGVEIPNKKLKVGSPYYQAHMERVGTDNLLVTEMNQVAEYSMKEDKLVWKKAIGNVKSIQRLPNGNTLMVEANANPSRIIEVAPDGEEVWSYQLGAGRLTIARAYRR